MINTLVNKKPYDFRIHRAFNILRLHVPLFFSFMACFMGGYFINKSSSYERGVELINWNVEAFTFTGIVCLLYAFLNLWMILRYVSHDFSTKLILYPNNNLVQIKRKGKNIQIHVSDIDSLAVQRIGAQNTIYSWDGYCRIKFKSGEEFFITSAVIKMDELYDFFRIGRKKTVQCVLFAFVPMRNKKTAIKIMQPPARKK